MHQLLDIKYQRFYFYLIKSIDYLSKLCFFAICSSNGLYVIRSTVLFFFLSLVNLMTIALGQWTCYKGEQVRLLSMVYFMHMRVKCPKLCWFLYSFRLRHTTAILAPLMLTAQIGFDILELIPFAVVLRRAFTSSLLYAICWYILRSRHKNRALPGLAKSYNCKNICNCAVVPS